MFMTFWSNRSFPASRHHSVFAADSTEKMIKGLIEIAMRREMNCICHIWICPSAGCKSGNEITLLEPLVVAHSAFVPIAWVWRHQPDCGALIEM